MWVFFTGYSVVLQSYYKATKCKLGLDIYTIAQCCCWTFNSDLKFISIKMHQIFFTSTIKNTFCTSASVSFLPGCFWWYFSPSHQSIWQYGNSLAIHFHSFIFLAWQKLKNGYIGNELKHFSVLWKYRPCMAWGFNQIVFNLNHINLTHAVFYYPFSPTPYSAMSIKETVHL